MQSVFLLASSGWPVVMAQVGGLGQTAGANGPIVSAQNRRFFVVIDAAHGGEDGGARLSDQTPEKTVTLALSVRLRSLLMARGFQVLTTREGNVNLTADQRAQIANHAQAAVCLSLHATEAGAGVHIFVSSLAPEVQGRFLAWKTAQAAYVTRSLKLASVLNSSFEHGSNNGTQGSDGGQNAADSNGNADSGTSSDTTSGPIPTTLTRTSLPGVDSMTCPALAVEIAPLRGDDHNVTTDVTDEQYQTQVVEDMAAAVLEWRTEWDSELHPENKLENKLENNLENRLVKQSGIKMELIKPGVRPEIKLEMIKPGEKPGEKPGAKPGAKPGEMPGKPASAQAGGKPRIQPGAGKSSGNGGAAPARSQQP